MMTLRSILLKCKLLENIEMNRCPLMVGQSLKQVNIFIPRIWC